jgi:hypothetical protein
MPPKIMIPQAQLSPNLAQTIAIIPSTYGLLAWVATLLLIPLASTPISPLSDTTIFVIIYTLFLFGASMAFHARYARSSLIRFEPPKLDLTLLFVFGATALVGGLGLLIYLRDVSSYAGGFGGLTYAVLSQDLLTIRAISGELDSIGTQLSYFSWIAIFLGFAIFLRSDFHLLLRIAVLFATGLLLFGNLFFIDRTRPLWIMTPVFMTLFFAKPFYKYQLARVAFAVPVGGIALFFAFTAITGKYTSYGQVDALFVYTTGSYGYLDALIEDQSFVETTFVRTFYWLAKLFELFGGNVEIPSQILDFRYVPFPTNVGTFLEPILSDVGFLPMFLMMPILIFALDRVALRMFRNGDYFSLLVWGNIIFTLMISFFVPKYNQLPLWLFMGIAIGMRLLTHSSPVRAN